MELEAETGTGGGESGAGREDWIEGETIEGDVVTMHVEEKQERRGLVVVADVGGEEGVETRCMCISVRHFVEQVLGKGVFEGIGDG